MKKLVLGLMIGLLVGCSASCIAKSDFGLEFGDSVYTWRNGFDNKAQDVVDKETGVHYWAIYDEDSLNALEVRYDSDGKVMVDK